MAKGKSANPADAFRKAQRKKELKKNKTARLNKRDLALVKKDTHDLEDEIQKIEAKDKPSAGEQERLEVLKAEFEMISKKKEEYVKDHPEARRLVYRPRRRENEEEEEVVLPTRKLFKKNGLPRHPERSIYYHPIMNSFGVAPPGMPYAERPLRPDEIDSEEEMGGSDEDEDEDIAMPDGPPPIPGEELVGSDDDIPMPDGPPPGQEEDALFMAPPSIPVPNIPPPPPHFIGTSIPPPPTPQGYPPFPPTFQSGIPFVSYPPNMFPPPPPAFPPPPPGFFNRQQSSGSIHDPLALIPHQTFQARRSGVQTPSAPSTSVTAAATISAAPELRDLKKEATAFVPTALKRKKAVPTATSRVNAAPTLESSGIPSDQTNSDFSRPDLLGTLRNQFGPVPAPSALPAKPDPPKKKDDYDNFLQEMGDILHTSE